MYNKIYMHIDAYSFGRIIINGKAYARDVIIFPNRIQDHWWRKEGHYLQKQDLEGLVKEGITKLIVGTGASGVMQIAPDIESYPDESIPDIPGLYRI